MERFVKVFEAHGRQIMFLKDQNDEGDAKLSIITRIDGSEINFGVVFSGDDADADLDAAFDKADQEAADAYGKALIGCETPFDAFKALSGK